MVECINNAILILHCQGAQCALHMAYGHVVVSPEVFLGHLQCIIVIAMIEDGRIWLLAEAAVAH